MIPTVTLSPLQYCTGGSSQCHQARRINKKYPDCKGSGKTAFIHRHMILYVEIPREYTNILLESINKFSKVEGKKINIQWFA